MADNLTDLIKEQGFAQVMVVLKQPKSVKRKGAALAASTTDTQAVAAKLAKHFTFPAHSQAAELAAAVGGRKPRGPVRMYPNLGIMLGAVEAKGLRGLRDSSEVAAVRATPVLSLIRPVATTAPQPVNAGITWGVERLAVPKLWDKGFTGKGIIVGHLDTGVDGAHPALQGALHAFAKFDLQGNLVPDAPAEDSDEHGTHTAGTIAGRTVQGMSFGVAPGATLASAMVIEDGDTVARVLGGMNWVIGQGGRVLSMSLGIRGFHADWLEVTQILRSRNVLPVFAVGNEGPGTSRSPGNYAEALSVGACAQDDTVADFSSSQRFVRPNDPLVPDLVAPGVQVLSCIPNDKYAQMDGSSMATPHIAGLAAVLLEARPDATVDQLEAAILGSCKRPATMPKNRSNRGVPDGPRALDLLLKAKVKKVA